MKNLLNMTIEEIQELVEYLGQPKFRAKQIFEWLYKGIDSIEKMTNIPKQLQNQLSLHCYIGKLKIISILTSNIDGTKKYVLKLQDGQIIESVLMKYLHHFSLCISSQVGCKMGCKFCASSYAGFIRNLSAGEMVDQILTIQNNEGIRIGNIVLMGIGEPLDNYSNVIKFIRLINDKNGINIGLRHITLSTCGLVPKILDLSKEGIPLTLSVSLHSPSNTCRSEIMPINEKYSIDKILSACNIYAKNTGRRITFEYALIDGVNDSNDDAVQLANKLRGMLCHVNLIPVNTIADVKFKKSNNLKSFHNILTKKGIPTTIRREMGADISAACGQLRRDMEEE